MSFAGRKFGRVCRLVIETSPDASPLRISTGVNNHLTIPSAGQPMDELTIEFTINRKSWLSTQTGSFRIYGLRPETRDAIFKDAFAWTQFRAIQFFAGYQTFMPRIFNGTVLRAYSEKDGENVITVIDAFDGGGQMTNTFSSLPANGSQTAATVITRLASSMVGIQGPPVVGDFPVANLRGEVQFGNTWGLIRQKSNGQATITDGVVYVLQLNEGILGGQITDITTIPTDAAVPLINSDTGLLGAPRRTGIMVEWDMLFEPRLTMFQVVAIQSTFNRRFNGVYKVMGVRHHGVVSKAVLGDYQTTAQFLFGNDSAFNAAVQQSQEAAG